MIPAIGVMIAAYILTRMAELFAREGTKTWVKVFAAVTVLITIISVVDILNAGSRGVGLN